MPKNTDELSEESFACKEVTWKIPNFLDLPCTVGYYKMSPEFRFANVTWCLQLYPYAETSVDAGFVSIFLVRSQSSVGEHHVHYKIGFKTRHGEKYESDWKECTFDKNCSEWGVYRYLECSKIMDNRQLLVPDGTVTVFCQIRVDEEATPGATFRPQQYKNEQSQAELQHASSETEDLATVNQTEVEDASTSLQKLQLDYSKLLKSGEDSDVCLKVSYKEFRAHRCILRARSTVFSAMFKYETEEKASGEVVIDDLDPDAFPDFLQHVYAGCVESLSPKNVYSLYLAADKYDLQELKSECREYMTCTLSVDTFCDVMALALRHQEEELLKLTIEFFSKNLTKIIVTARWQTFLKDHHTEANELLIKALVPE